MKNKVEAGVKDRNDRQNKYDGLVWNKDGSKEFKDGGVVDGANNYLKTHLKNSHKKHHTDLSQKDAEDEYLKEIETEEAAVQHGVHAQSESGLDAYLKSHLKHVQSLAATAVWNDDDDEIKAAANQEI